MEGEKNSFSLRKSQNRELYQTIQILLPPCASQTQSRKRKGVFILCLSAIAQCLQWAPVLPCCAQKIRAGLLGTVSTVQYRYSIVYNPATPKGNLGRDRKQHSEAAARLKGEFFPPIMALHKMLRVKMVSVHVQSITCNPYPFCSPHF